MREINRTEKNVIQWVKSKTHFVAMKSYAFVIVFDMNSIFSIVTKFPTFSQAPQIKLWNCEKLFCKDNQNVFFNHRILFRKSRKAIMRTRNPEWSMIPNMIIITTSGWQYWLWCDFKFPYLQNSKTSPCGKLTTKGEILKEPSQIKLS